MEGTHGISKELANGLSGKHIEFLKGQATKFGNSTALEPLEKLEEGKPLTAADNDVIYNITSKNIGVFKQELEDKPFEKKVQSPAHIRELILTGGMPASGKSKMLEKLEKKQDLSNYVTVNSDEVKENAGYDGANSPLFHEHSSDVAKAQLKRAIDGGYSAVYDSQLANFGVADKAIGEMLSNGGKASILFTYIGIDTSLRRTVKREDDERKQGKPGRAVPDGAIAKGHNQTLPVFLELFKKYGNDPRVNFALSDNNTDGVGATRVFSKENGKMVIHDQTKYKELTNSEYIKKGETCERKEPVTEEQVRKMRDRKAPQNTQNTQNIKEWDPLSLIRNMSVAAISVGKGLEAGKGINKPKEISQSRLMEQLAKTFRRNKQELGPTGRQGQAGTGINTPGR